MKIRHFHLVSTVTGFNQASVVLQMPDDVADEDIPFDELWEEMGIEWGDLEIEGGGPVELTDAGNSNEEPDCILTRDEHGNIVVQK